MNIHSKWEGIESFMDFREAFQGMQPIYQILLFIALIALTVAAVAMAYYIVKYTFILIYEIFKALYNLVKSVAEGTINQTRPISRQSQYIVQQPVNTPTIRPVPAQPRPVTVPTQAPNSREIPKTITVLHCPMCGETFTSEMMNLLHRNGKVFCEYCGNMIENLTA